MAYAGPTDCCARELDQLFNEIDHTVVIARRAHAAGFVEFLERLQPGTSWVSRRLGRLDTIARLPFKNQNDSPAERRWDQRTSRHLSGIAPEAAAPPMEFAIGLEAKGAQRCTLDNAR
jgi:hypothetical protein